MSDRFEPLPYARNLIFGIVVCFVLLAIMPRLTSSGCDRDNGHNKNPGCGSTAMAIDGEGRMGGVPIRTMPEGAYNVDKKGKDWALFTLDVDGKPTRFLYRWRFNDQAVLACVGPAEKKISQ